MKQGTLSAAVSALALLAAPLLAQDARAPEKEDLSRWEFFKPVLMPPTRSDSPYAAFYLDEEVFTYANPPLWDLRLVNREGQEVPFALRIRTGETTTLWAQGEILNRGTTETGASRLELRLPDSVERHNAIRVELAGEIYRRRVTVYGSRDGQDWTRLASGWVYRLPATNGHAEHLVVRYPTSDFHFLRVEVAPDPELDEIPPTIRNVEAGYRMVKEPVYVDYRVQLGERLAARHWGRNSSVWIGRLGGEFVPVTELFLDARETGFARDVFVEYTESLTGGPEWRRLTRATWERKNGRVEPLALRFHEVRAAAFRIFVVDDRNPPLTLTEARARGHARQVVFPAEEAKEGLRLLFGNPDASDPSYDFERMLPDVLRPAPLQCGLGKMRRNPEFRMTLIDVVRRSPWIVHVAFAIATALVVVTLADTARRLVKRADEEGGGAEADDGAG